MNKLTSVIQKILELLLILIIINSFFHFLPKPKPSPEMRNFFAALAATGYMMPFILIIEAISGVLLLVNKYTPLVLAVLTPIIINALAAHLFLNGGGGIGAAVAVTALMGYLIYAYRKRFYPLLKPNTVTKK